MTRHVATPAADTPAVVVSFPAAATPEVAARWEACVNRFADILPDLEVQAAHPVDLRTVLNQLDYVLGDTLTLDRAWTHFIRSLGDEEVGTDG